MSPSDRLSSPSRLLRHGDTQELTYCRNNYNTFTNKRISVYTDMNLDTNNYFVIQISHLSKGVTIAAFTPFQKYYLCCCVCYICIICCHSYLCLAKHKFNNLYKCVSKPG